MFVQNLVPILPISVKLHAVNQSGSVFSHTPYRCDDSNVLVVKHTDIITGRVTRCKIGFLKFLTKLR